MAIGGIFLYIVIAFIFCGLMIYGCVKEHVAEAGTEYERLMSNKPVELNEIVPDDFIKDERPITNL